MFSSRSITIALITTLFLTTVRANESGNVYTILDPTQYQKTVKDSREAIERILISTDRYRYQAGDERMGHVVRQLIDIPHIYSGAEGEGDWQPASSTYQPGAVHIKQDPVYRLDGLDCLTFVQIAMTLFYSNNLDEFDRNFLKIAYGAANNPSGEIVHYYNRNHFIDGDWNPVNQRNGWLTDLTGFGELSRYSKTTSLTINRQNWFLQKGKDLRGTVRVLNDVDGITMAKRYSTVYSSLNYPNFDAEHVTIAYFPKEVLAIKQSDGSYLPNQTIIDKIQTPAILEIVRDARKWTIGGKNVKAATGSETSVSHMGILYHKNFQYGEVIYQKTTCKLDSHEHKVCVVQPRLCQKKQCDELMLAHATSAFPNGYYWYKNGDGRYTCSSKLPANDIAYTQCNRVQESPLFDYLTDIQQGYPLYMDSPSILGVHIERLSE